MREVRRYHLQRREQVEFPNNHSLLVNYRWETIAIGDAREPLEDLLACCSQKGNYRIEDTFADLKGGDGG